MCKFGCDDLFEKDVSVKENLLDYLNHQLLKMLNHTLRKLIKKL